MYRLFQLEESFAAIIDAQSARQSDPKHWGGLWNAGSAGDQAVGQISPDLLLGMWTLRFGMFGCRDSETRGGTVYVDDGQLFGGDDSFAYHGAWAMRGTELQTSLHIVRHSHRTGRATLFGTDEDHYSVDCIAEAISADRIEGRIRRPGFPDARLTMRRLAGEYVGA